MLTLKSLSDSTKIATTGGFGNVFPAICFKTEEYGRKVSEGVIEDSSFYYVKFACPMDVEWDSEEALRLANPALESGVV